MPLCIVLYVRVPCQPPACTYAHVRARGQPACPVAPPPASTHTRTHATQVAPQATELTCPSVRPLGCLASLTRVYALLTNYLQSQTHGGDSTLAPWRAARPACAQATRGWHCKLAESHGAKLLWQSCATVLAQLDGAHEAGRTLHIEREIGRARPRRRYPGLGVHLATSRTAVTNCSRLRLQTHEGGGK